MEGGGWTDSWRTEGDPCHSSWLLSIAYIWGSSIL